jgi:3-oxoacyl-[acyl-carrier-protein] synthase II
MLGTGSSCVFNPPGVLTGTRPALANAMRAALRSAGLTPDQIGHVNAHGLGTQETDIEEAKAILDVFGSELGRRVPVTAPKSFMGNSGAGCGTLELAASVLGLSRGLIPHTLNYETPDPNCPLNVVAGQPRETNNRVVLNINVSRAGQASAVIVEVY